MENDLCGKRIRFGLREESIFQVSWYLIELQYAISVLQFVLGLSELTIPDFIPMSKDFSTLSIVHSLSILLQIYYFTKQKTIGAENCVLGLGQL